MIRMAVRLSRLVLMLFLAAQAFDGVFTYVAVNAVGTRAESNAFLAFFMTLIGPGPALMSMDSERPRRTCWRNRTTWRTPYWWAASSTRCCAGAIVWDWPVWRSSST